MNPDLPPVVAFLPGNGHVDARLDPARAAMDSLKASRRFVLRGVDYGQGSAECEEFPRMLQHVAAQLRGAQRVYATGIGGLIVLALRAEGELLDQRCILQGPVLWGLETRLFPRLMRLPGMTRLLVWALRRSALRRRFERKHFLRPLPPALREAFFAGYDDPGAFSRWFRWLDPALLRRLEVRLCGHPERLRGIEAWWGEQDQVVGVDELRRTEAALGTSFPLRRFADWGHYPMIDDPAGWVREVSDALASPVAV